MILQVLLISCTLSINIPGIKPSDSLLRALLIKCTVIPVIITDGSEGHFRSPESLSSFKVIPLTLLLLISALLLSEIIFYRSRCIGQLTGFLVSLTVFCIFL